MTSCRRLVSTRFGLRSFENRFEKFMLPKRRIWKTAQSVACAFLKCFSRVWVLVLGYHWLKSRSKTHTQLSVRPSKNRRLGNQHKLCSPNVDFGRLNKHFGAYVQSKWFENVPTSDRRYPNFWLPNSRLQLVTYFSTTFWTFRQKCQPGFVFNTFVEMFKMEIVEK